MNNQSQALTIEVLISLEWFTVQFETDSIERNRLMTVRYNSFLLDTAELPHTHPTYYKEIKKEMCKAAEAYWNSLNEASEKPANKEITGIPTLDYQEKKQVPFLGIFDEINKAFFTLIIFLLPAISFSQAFIGAEATNYGIGINAGYIANNLQLKAGFNSGITRKSDVPNIFYASAGYQLTITNYEENNISLIPSVGIAKYHVTDLSKYHDGGDPVEVNKLAFLTSVDLGKNFTLQNGIEGRYYILYTRAVKSFFGAGFKIFIK